MSLWLANSYWGLDAEIERRKVYRTVYSPLANLIIKRRKMHDLAIAMCKAGFIRQEKY